MRQKKTINWGCEAILDIDIDLMNLGLCVDKQLWKLISSTPSTPGSNLTLLQIT